MKKVPFLVVLMSLLGSGPSVAATPPNEVESQSSESPNPKAEVTAWNAAPIPAKTVVLTFDDSVKSHRTFVAPLLKELGFHGTFFVSQRWMDDERNYMSWNKIGELHAMGFEVGNHSWTHANFSAPKNAARLAGETALIDYQLAKTSAKVPRPLSFAYSGNFFGPEAFAKLNQLGYKFARRGEMPEVRYATLDIGPTYDPRRHHPLLIPTTGDAYPNWSLEHFQRVVSRATAGQIVVLQFHGVPDGRHDFVSTPPERFREYMQYLKENEFQCLAIRDLEPFIDRDHLPDDPLSRTRYSNRNVESLPLPVEMEASRKETRFWLENMLVHHNYSPVEAAEVLGWTVDEVDRRASELQIDFRGRDGGASPSDGKRPNGVTKILPYPGGRHPRIGFLDGALDPLRGTKVSVFAPWADGGYAVLDLPEAIFSKSDLIWLAHTHLPTVWDRQSLVIDNLDWVREADGSFRSHWKLPGGLELGSHIVPVAKGAQLELWLQNGSNVALHELLVQVCLMLKAMPEFNEQNQERKDYVNPLAVVKSVSADRYVMLGFQRCARVLGNERCPCIHSDPQLPDAQPGQRVAVRGLLRFYEGPDSKGEQRRLVEDLDRL